MLKIFKKAIKAIIFLSLLVLVAFFWYRQASQPKIDGSIKMSGLGAAVDIVRDSEGIPHIYAHSADDAYFALGFVHAQDRLWQLELNRRIAAGRMAEILGPDALPVDRFLRTLGVRRNAEKIIANLSPAARTALESYARGITAYLAQRGGPLPPEFLMTGAPAPEPWQPADSIGWQTMMAWDLGANWMQELLRMRLAQRLPLQRINEFLPPYPGDAPLQTQDYTQLYRQLGTAVGHMAALTEIAPPSYVDGMGSNNWVVAGALSASGKPLLANDPHLGLSAPSLWYLAHLSAPGLNVIGATLPGMPSVVLGHNERIAWGFTNTGPDVQDLYIEHLRPGDVQQYQTPDGWAGFTVHTEIIKVKGKPDVALEVKESRHGPVISGALALVDKAALDKKNYAIAFAWTGLRPDDLTAQAAIRFNQARNWTDFLDAAKDFSTPQQNMVYADVDGNIGYVAPGRIPLRKPDNDLHGLAPAPGWDARYDWNGFIPFDRLPQQYNPATQKIVTANQKIVSPDYPYFLTSEWTLPYRADRINTLLDAQSKHTPDSFAAMQQDRVSLAAQELLPLMLKTVPDSNRARDALAQLAHWDGRMDANRVEPLIFNAWLREISRSIFQDKLGADLMGDYWEHRNMHQPMVNILSNKDGQGNWCGKLLAAEPAEPAVPQQKCDALMKNALTAALDDLSRRYGNDMSAWRWGVAHPARSEHRPFGSVGWLAGIFDIRVPSGGDTFTVNAGRYNLRDEKEPFVNRHAAGLRAIYDTADWENSRFIQSTGQSGNLLSPLYRNYAQRWADGTYLPMHTKRETVQQNAMGTLTLTP
jgi:penicillin G amidase